MCNAKNIKNKTIVSDLEDVKATVTPRGEGYLSTFCGMGTCHDFEVSFFKPSWNYGYRFHNFRIFSRNYGYPFQKFCGIMGLVLEKILLKYVNYSIFSKISGVMAQIFFRFAEFWPYNSSAFMEF